MENLTDLQSQGITKFLGELKTEIDVNDYVNIEEIDFSDAYNSIYEMIDNNDGFNIEIIYYSNAIKYLMENDPSLKESLEIASEYGYTTENLNSELLATLLASKNAREEFNDLENEINEFFTELAEEIENENEL